jgi:hypothetical protein
MYPVVVNATKHELTRLFEYASANDTFLALKVVMDFPVLTTSTSNAMLGFMEFAASKHWESFEAAYGDAALTALMAHVFGGDVSSLSSDWLDLQLDHLLVDETGSLAVELASGETFSLLRAAVETAHPDLICLFQDQDGGQAVWQADGASISIRDVTDFILGKVSGTFDDLLDGLLFAQQIYATLYHTHKRICGPFRYAIII